MKSKPGTFHFVTLGCKSNQYDSAAMAADLKAAGMAPADPETAELVVINTCMVTGSTEAQCRKAIRRVRRRNAGASIVVSGCMTRGAGDQLAAMPEADLVITPDRKGSLPQELGFAVTEGWDDWPEDPAVGSDGRDRFFIKVQDGCDHACSYCIVPTVRGRSRSLPPERVVKGIRTLMDGRRREVVLTGIHLGLYGSDLPGGNRLEGLLEMLLAESLPGRIRLSSIEPGELSRSLLHIIGTSQGRICRHLHIPVQSGSGRLLNVMNRPYGAGLIPDVVADARSAIPGVGIGFDMICGFPGETDDDHQRSLDLVRSLNIPFLHAFPFSPRPGTAAAAMADDATPLVKKRRVRALQDAAAVGHGRFLESLVGERLCVVPEGNGSGGLSDNYARVSLDEAQPASCGETIKVRIVGKRGDRLLGHPEMDR